MKIFISYSTSMDQIVALRLQALATVYGFTTYVPPAQTRQTSDTQLTEEVQRKLLESDVVLGVMMHDPANSALSEMNLALATGKLLMPILGPLVSAEYYGRFVPHFVLNPADPSQTESQIVQFLAHRQQAGNSKTALLALTTLAVGLLLFSSQSK